MSVCTTCAERNPAQPVYSKARPASNDHCEVCGESLFGTDFQTSSATGKNTELIAGNLISITDLSDSNTDRFLVAVIQYEALTVGLSVVARDAGDVILDQPILWGNVVNKYQLTWSYNKAIVSQSLSNDAGLTPPTLGVVDFSFEYNSLTISNQDVEFTIQGNDGEGQGGSIATDVVTVAFANYRVWGAKPRYDQGSTTLAQLQTAIEDLIQTTGTTEKTTTRVKSGLTSDASGSDYFYYCYPKRWGFATFLQNGIPGGFKRLKNVGGTIEVGTFDAEDAGESDILISNGVGSEAFYVYQSASENTVGAVFDVQ